MPIINIPEDEEFYDTNAFYYMRSLTITYSETINEETIFDYIKTIEVESHTKISDNKLEINFFDYTSLYMGLEIFMKEKPEYEYEISKKHIKQNILNAYYAGASRHVFLLDGELDELDLTDTENNKKNYEQLFGIKNLYSLIYNQEKNVMHFKFYDTESAFEFAFKLTAESRRFGFQRRKGPGILHNQRTVYLGNITDEILGTDLIQILKGGSLVSLKFLRSKYCAFATFCNPWAAEAYMKLAEKEPVIVKEKTLKICPGNAANLQLSIILQIAEGYTRIFRVKNFSGDTESFSDQPEIIELHYDENDMIVECVSIPEAINISELEIFDKYEKEFMDDPCGKINAFDLMLELED